MIHFNKKTEYALLAIEHMVHKEGENQSVTNTREISNTYHIPYPIMAKVMQKLAGKGFIKSVQGIKGGYVLVKKPTDMTVASVIEIFDGPFAVVDCFRDEKITCPQWGGCLIRDPFYELNHKIYTLLAETTIADLAKKREDPSRKGVVI